MDKLFIITEAQDVEGRRPYKPKFYISLEDKHIVKFSQTGSFYLPSEEGKKFINKELGVDWNGYYSLDYVPNEFKRVQSNYNLLSDIIKGKINSGKIN